MIITFDTTADPTLTNILPYYIAVYSPAGDLLSFRKLQSELMLCPHSENDAIHAKSFGVNMAISCTMDMTTFLTNYQTYLYELYIQDSDKSYKPVPVLITNMVIGTIL
jgi:hypothetical protein